MTETPYGNVTVLPEAVAIDATADQLQEWARCRQGSDSKLATLPGAYARFAVEGLEDTDVGPDVLGEEFDAWSADAAREVLPRDHSCLLVVVGQFDDGR